LAQEDEDGNAFQHPISYGKMMNYKKFILFVLSIILSGCVPKQYVDNHWYSTTMNDLKFIKNMIVTHSAPAVNAQDHQFINWLEKGFIRASEHAKKAKNSDNYIDILQFYVRGFKLDHLNLRFTDNSKLKDWFYPGFLIRLLGDRYVIGYVDPKISYPYPIKSGAVIIEIDGKPIDVYMKNVFAVLYGNKYTKAEYIRLAPHLLIDKNNFLIKRPKYITLLERGRYKKINLIWYPKEIDELWSISQSLAFGGESLIGYKLPELGIRLIFL
jgi:hypothetical protein